MSGSCEVDTTRNSSEESEEPAHLLGAEEEKEKEEVHVGTKAAYALTSLPILERGDLADDRCVVGLYGFWYDVTDFIPEHPGGEVIERFHGCDATEIFAGFHAYKPGLLKTVKELRIGRYRRSSDELTAEYLRKNREYRQRGYMATSVGWWLWNTSRIVLLFVASMYTLFAGWPSVAGLLLALFWQQCGGYLHDCMHTTCTYNRTMDSILGWWFGTVCTGINAAWWKREHDLHHSLVNTHTIAKDGTRVAVDIQMKEDIWAQTADVLPLFPADNPFRFLLKYQAWYFLPAVFCLGRVGIILNAYRSERDIRQWIGFAIHIAATVYICRMLPDWYTVGVFYACAAVGEGMLHLQLIVNHYLNCWTDEDDAAHDFVRWTYISTHNVFSPRWLDWFQLGLHLHVEHHLFPKVSRCHLRDIQPDVIDLGARHNLPYRELSLPRSPWALYKSFATAAAKV